MIILTSSRDNQVLQVHPGLSDQICLLIVVENGNFKFVVIRRLVYCETQFVIPSRCLSAAQICWGFLCLFTESGSAVWVLFAHSFAIGEVLRSIDNGDEGTNWRTVDRHVGEDARGMIDLGEFRHLSSLLTPVTRQAGAQ